MNTFEWEDGTIVERPYVEIDSVKHYVQDGTYSGGTAVSSNNLNEMQNIINDNITDSIDTAMSKIGKTLWEGTFSTGTLQIPNLSDYTMICIFVGNVMMMGNQYYGGTSFRAYRSTSVNHYVYRFSYDSENNSLITTTDNPGASDGTNQLTITKIVGVF